MNSKLLNIDDAINMYKNLHMPEPKFGMDVLSRGFNARDIVVLQNNGTKQTGTPARFNFYTLLLCLHGGTIRNVNQYTYTVRECTLQLLPPGTVHSFEDTFEHSQYYVLLFNESVIELKETMDFHSKNFNHVELNPSLFSKVKELYEEIDYEFKNKSHNFMEYVKVLIGQIVIILQREKMKLIEPKCKTRGDVIASDFLELVEENFLTLKNISDYAKIVEITPKHLSETIKEKLGKSAMYFIHKRIIKEAEYLLVHTKMSIYAVGSYLNFRDASQFSRFFKKHKGVSPKEYRINVVIKH